MGCGDCVDFDTGLHLWRYDVGKLEENHRASRETPGIWASEAEAVGGFI